jgi:hypothetical protein
MGQSYLLYTIEPHFRKILHIGDAYYEIWQGLPDLDFKKTEARGGQPALRYQTGRDYIWVTPSAVLAVKNRARSILAAQVVKAEKEAIVVPCVFDIFDTAFGETSKTAIRRATELNREIVSKRLEGMV